MNTIQDSNNSKCHVPNKPQKLTIVQKNPRTGQYEAASKKGAKEKVDAYIQETKTAVLTGNIQEKEIDTLVKKTALFDPALSTSLSKKHKEFKDLTRKYADEFEGEVEGEEGEVDLSKLEETKGQLDKTIQVARRNAIEHPDYLPVAFHRQGKVKDVYIPVSEQNPQHVYYVARSDGPLDCIVNLKEFELKDEAKIAARFKDKLGNHPGGKYLALDYQELSPDEGIEGKKTYRVELASRGDLQTALDQGEITFEQGIQLISNIARGWEALEDGGILHGDPKLENILLYEKDGKLVAKISDFGKSKESEKPGQEFIYLGNPSHESPERTLSQKSEVYSEAIMWMEILERDFLNEEGWLQDVNGNLYKPKEMKDLDSASPKRRGILKFMLLNKRMTQIDTVSPFAKAELYPKRASSIISSSIDFDAEKELKGYIKVLCENLQNSGKMDAEQAESLQLLLEFMTRASPEKRLPKKLARAFFEDIFKKELSL